VTARLVSSHLAAPWQTREVGIILPVSTTALEGEEKES